MPRLAIFGFAAIIGLGTIAVALDYNSYKTTQETFQATVLNKERVCHMVADYETVTDEDGNDHQVQTGSHEECTNYVHTDRETLINDGVIWSGSYDATAMQGRLVPGELYTFKVYGKGNERMGEFRKIITVAKIIPGSGSFGGAGSKNW